MDLSSSPGPHSIFTILIERNPGDEVDLDRDFSNARKFNSEIVKRKIFLGNILNQKLIKFVRRMEIYADIYGDKRI